MPPRLSSNRGSPRGGRPSRGGYHGGATRGSLPGGPSSTSANTDPNETHLNTPESTIPPSQPNSPSVFRGQGSENRARGRGRGSNRGGTTPGSPSIPTTTPQIPASIHATFPTAFGEGSVNRGRGGGPGRRGTSGQPFRARGGYRGSTRGGFGAGGPVDITEPTENPYIPNQIITFGAKRPRPGTGGFAKKIIINAFKTTATDGIIYQYNVVVHNGKLPARVNMELLRILQQEEAVTFTPKVVYDGQKIIFSTRDLLSADSQTFVVSRPRSDGGPPKLYDIIFTRSGTINSELLHRYIAQKLSHDENVSTILAALNVAIKMEPNQTHPFNKRSFYIPDGKQDIGGGIELWRGIFQSVRPTLDRLIVNIDLSTGMMYKEGPLLNLCIDYFGRRPDTSPNAILTGETLREYERNKLQKFLSGVRVKVVTTGDKERVVRGLSKEGADRLTFETRPGIRITVAQHFQSLNMSLQYPSVICALVGQTAMVPLEFCMVPKGQFMRKEIPDDKVKEVLKFSTKKPHDRLNAIKDGLRRLQYGQSEYVRNFGMTIDQDPLSTNARVIQAPKLKYNEVSRQPTIEPKDGAWNMIDKKFYEPSTIVRWAIVIYESSRYFPEPAFKGMVDGFLKACDAVGIRVVNRDPLYKLEDGQGSIERHLKNAVDACRNQFNEELTLIVVVLPENGGDIYNAVKHFGDITFGIPTQCLKAFHCRSSKPQYWNNVMLKVNVKLGGINVIPDPSSLAGEALSDPANPAIVMGADVAHPPPGVNRPSYTAIIGSIDSNTAKYVAASRAQTGRQEIINDMKEMCMDILAIYKKYQVETEKKQFKLSRLIFYRDGVSESQFKHVLELELPMIQAACEEFGVNPKITLIIVGKRHHIQFFPSPGEGDFKSGNCLAGTVVDRDVTHPTDHDFYLLSHAGILGTSRPAHYSVLYDDSNFNADALQSLSYSLCHVYAPSTRSVSVPAPVYYADLVCSRAKTHFDPLKDLDASTNVSGLTDIEAFKNGFMQLHSKQQKAMYFA